MKGFENHKAKLITDNEVITVIDWQDENGSSDYFVRYIIDKQRGSLIISGDLGDCISCWYNPVSISNLRNFIKNIPYWMGKFQCTSDDYDYDWEDIESDLNDIKEEYLNDIEDYDFTEEEIEEDFKEMLEICEDLTFSSHMTYPSDLIELMEKYNTDWWESDFVRIGKRVSPRVYLWSDGFIQACNQLGI